MVSDSRPWPACGVLGGSVFRDPAGTLRHTVRSARRGRRFTHLPELAIRGAISDTEMQRWIARIERLSSPLN
jgi:hypothetical protein